MRIDPKGISKSYFSNTPITKITIMKKQLTIAAAVLLTAFQLPAMAQTPDRGPKPPQPREGWITPFLRESAAMKWNERAAKFNDAFDTLFQTKDGATQASVDDFYAVLDQNCSGTMGEAIGGLGELQPIIHGGLCGQYKTDLKTFLKRGKTKNFAQCRALHKAYDRLTSLRDKPHWWYIGQEGERLEKHLKWISNSPMQIKRPNSDKVIAEFSCPMKD
jgi:hypothetical protein